MRNIERIWKHETDWAGQGDWQKQAESLAREGVEFAIDGFSYPHDLQFCYQLAAKFGLKFSFDPNENRAWFLK